MTETQKMRHEQAIKTHEANALGYRIKIEEAKESIARLEAEVAHQNQEREKHMKALGRTE